MRATGLATDARTALLESAVLAPSMHNTQPWRFALGTHSVRVYRDLDRWLRADDPTRSALYVSLGAVVLNLRVAAAELGYLARVSLLPDPDDPDCVARVTLAGGLGVDAELASLFPYLRRRRTNRRPFADRWVPERALHDLVRAAQADGTHLHMVRDPSVVRRLLGLAAEGTLTERHQLTRLLDRARWVGGPRSRDGVPSSALGPRPHEAEPLVRDLAVRSADQDRPRARFERYRVLAVLSTERDDPLGWLRAGEALQRVLLTASRWGLSASFLNQALDDDRLPELVPGGAEGAAYPQMVMRLGYGAPTDPTPRRPLEDFVRVPASDAPVR